MAGARTKNADLGILWIMFDLLTSTGMGLTAVGLIVDGPAGVVKAGAPSTSLTRDRGTEVRESARNFTAAGLGACRSLATRSF
jgi:hypothetical protein